MSPDADGGGYCPHEGGNQLPPTDCCPNGMEPIQLVQQLEAAQQDYRSPVVPQLLHEACMAAAEEALKEALCVAGMHHALAGLLFVCQRQELAPLAQAALCSLWNLASPLKLRSEVAQGSVAHALRDTIDHLGSVPDVLEWSARVAWLLAEEPSTSELLTACSIPEAPTLGLLEILKAPAANDSSFSSDLSSPTGAGARSFTSDREPRGSSLGQPSRLPDGPAGPNSGTKRPEKEDQCLIPGPCAQVSATVGDVGEPPVVVLATALQDFAQGSGKPGVAEAAARSAPTAHGISNPSCSH